MEQRNNQAGRPNHCHWLSRQKRFVSVAFAESRVVRRPRTRSKFIAGLMNTRLKEHHVDAQLARRSLKMRRRMRGTVLALVAALVFSPLIFAQTAEQPGAETAQA